MGAQIQEKPAESGRGGQVEEGLEELDVTEHERLKSGRRHAPDDDPAEPAPALLHRAARQAASAARCALAAGPHGQLPSSVLAAADAGAKWLRDPTFSKLELWHAILPATATARSSRPNQSTSGPPAGHGHVIPVFA